ncbi:sterol-sensing domain of SREBP cleavage-activation-domain-containing protein [Podospora aff. communis PSN243]|uniref:Sterol regulatory element-binding protein cleavage-activating protein n=1 Tax=Podospora aff. communis PSN243 TaxID=3040156 RepID=A0AAV9GLL7_9PEZI|nr:sterol-sensing domain of SREBP cleavage-activation-domain-containing protein [Podospora aff. communis PSN243]
MLWYLLYPIRGTTEAPVLAPSHPLRAAFSRYGVWAARHVQIVLPISTAIVFVFLYMFPFLYTTDATNITSGVSNLPKHVWTDAQPLGSRADLAPDVIMRSIWVHGSYMKALDREVLLGALNLQDELLGPTTNFNPRQPAPRKPVAAAGSPELAADLSRTERDAFHIINGVTDSSWFFHSPLQYWSGNASNIAADMDIVSTVNARKTQSTSVNVTLRHSIVFSGKRFEDRKLVAADALVITLIHLRDSPVGKQWVRKLEALAHSMQDKWQVYPEDGRSPSSQLYEFQFRPMSWFDLVVLSIAYSLTLVYLILSLSRLHAVKSRLGLMVTIVCQIAASIVSSFTVCAIFKVDLSRIPYYAYPLVILAISMENSLRLINAVIMTSSSVNIHARIGEAFGATAHVAMANRFSNLGILLGLSMITVPGVAAFCTFAAVAIIFDFFYLATFFLSVLSVDVRQRELSELEKASLKRTKSQQSHGGNPTWADTFRNIRFGDVSLSTRIAGTFVALGFVLTAQLHYAPDSWQWWLNHLFKKPWENAGESPKSSLLINIHQARSPTSWLRLQDHETAREVINVIKPWAHSYIALVYDPVVFVLKGSDRNPQGREPYFLPAVYDFFHHEIYRFLVMLMTMIAMIVLFTRYLLRDGVKQPGDPEHPEDEPLLSIQTLSRDHALDVEMMTSSPEGYLVSVGLDRTIQVWDVPSGARSRVLCDAEVPLENPFPVWGMAVDDSSKQLALVSVNSVFLWDIEQRQWGAHDRIELDGARPKAVFFNPKKDAPPSLVVVRRNGIMTELYPGHDRSSDYVVCKTPLVLAVPFVEYASKNNTPRMSIITASKKSCIHVVNQDEDGWISREVKLTHHGEARESKGIHSLIPIPSLSLYLVGRSRSVELVDLESSSILFSFPTEPMKPLSLRHIASVRPQQNGLASLTLAYNEAETEDLVIRTYLPDDETDVIYSYNPVDARNGHRQSWAADREIVRRVSKPGAWEALSNGSIVGVRRRPFINGLGQGPATNSVLRRLSVSRQEPVPPAEYIDEPWEAWVMSHLEAGGDIEHQLLDDPSRQRLSRTRHHPPRQLLICKPGPMVRLGTMSVAVGFGNLVKVISVGHEHFDKAQDRMGAGGDLRNMIVRRRKTGGLARIRASY